MDFLTYIFNSVTYSLAVVNDKPNWDKAPTLDVQLITNIDWALTRKESRRCFTAIPRYATKYEILFDSPESKAAWRMAQDQLRTRMVVVPMWWDITTALAGIVAGNTSINFKTTLPPAHTSTHWLIMDSLTGSYEIVNVTAISSTAITIPAGVVSSYATGAYLIPLVFGRWNTQPKISDHTDWYGTVAIDFTEDSPYVFKAGPNPNLYTLPTVGSGIPTHSTERLMDIVPDWTTEPTEVIESDIDFNLYGYGKQSFQYEYPQATRRAFTFQYTQTDRASIARLEAIFLDRSGDVGAVWVPSWQSDMRPNEDLPDGVNAAKVTIISNRYTNPAYAGHPGLGYISLIGGPGIARNLQPQQVNSILGDVLTLAANVTGTWLKSSTAICALILSRFKKNVLSWQYTTDTFATTSVDFVESTEDYFGQQAEINTQFLYRIVEQNPQNPTWYFTSSESPITALSQTWVPYPIDHNSLSSSFDLTKDDCQITSPIQVGNPFLRAVPPLYLNGKLKITIWMQQTNRNSGGTSQTAVFDGEVTEIDNDGPKLTAMCAAFGPILDAPFPSFRFGKSCNHKFNDSGCKIPISDSFGTQITVDATKTLITLNFGPSSFPVNFWAFGLMYVPTPGTYEVRAILASSASVSNNVTYQIDRPFNYFTFGVSAALVARRGCARTLTACDSYNNRVNFGGFPFIPPDNPSVMEIPLAQNQSGGGGK